MRRQLGDRAMNGDQWLMITLAILHSVYVHKHRGLAVRAYDTLWPKSGEILLPFVKSAAAIGGSWRSPAHGKRGNWRAPTQPPPTVSSERVTTRLEASCLLASGEFAPSEHHWRFPAPYDLTFSLTTEEPGLATGNVPAASRTRRHTWLKWLRVRLCYPPWNVALLCRLCGQVGDRSGSAVRRAVNRQRLREPSDHSGTCRKHVPMIRRYVRAGEYIWSCSRSR
jgi:hypothetical protein